MSENKPKRKRRTKEQIEADKAKKEKTVGAGDVVEKITKATGIKAFVEFMNGGEPCSGCEKRKNALNKLRFRKSPKPLTVDDIQFIERIKNRNTLSASEVALLYQTHARIWNYKYTIAGNCSGCVKQKASDLIELYQGYKNETTD